MEKIRGFIRITALTTLVLVIGFHCYAFFTDVSKADVREVISTYAQKCNISTDGGSMAFGHIAANASKVSAKKMNSILVSETKIQLGLGSITDFLAVGWYKFRETVGYRYEQRIEQAAMKAGISAFEKHLDKCSLADA